MTKTPPHHHKNTTTPHKHHHKNTTIKTPPQKHHHKEYHKNTTTPPQKRHHKNTTTRTPPQKHHHQNTTTKTQKHHHTTTKTPPNHTTWAGKKAGTKPTDKKKKKPKKKIKKFPKQVRTQIVLPANNVANMSAKSFGCGGVVIVRAGCLSSERSHLHMRGFFKCSDICSDFQARNSCRCMRWISQLFSFACFVSINATHRFVQVPPCSPALNSPAANDEHVNGKPLTRARSNLRVPHDNINSASNVSNQVFHVERRVWYPAGWEFDGRTDGPSTWTSWRKQAFQWRSRVEPTRCPPSVCMSTCQGLRPNETSRIRPMFQNPMYQSRASFISLSHATLTKMNNITTSLSSTDCCIEIPAQKKQKNNAILLLIFLVSNSVSNNGYMSFTTSSVSQVVGKQQLQMKKKNIPNDHKISEQIRGEYALKTMSDMFLEQFLDTQIPTPQCPSPPLRKNLRPQDVPMHSLVCVCHVFVMTNT